MRMALQLTPLRLWYARMQNDLAATSVLQHAWQAPQPSYQAIKNSCTCTRNFTVTDASDKEPGSIAGAHDAYTMLGRYASLEVQCGWHPIDTRHLAVCHTAAAATLLCETFTSGWQ
jgi:hypothetical protein